MTNAAYSFGYLFVDIEFEDGLDFYDFDGNWINWDIEYEFDLNDDA